MIGCRHDSNRELVGQGLANLVSPLCGGIAATGAIARTATSVRSGGRTPVAGMVHSIALLLIVLLAAPLARFIPLATFSGVLMVVAWRMERFAKTCPSADMSAFTGCASRQRAVWTPVALFRPAAKQPRWL